MHGGVVIEHRNLVLLFQPSSCLVVNWVREEEGEEGVGVRRAEILEQDMARGVKVFAIIASSIVASLNTTYIWCTLLELTLVAGT